MFNTVLYLPSTPLNILVSCAHALESTENSTSELWLIDQKNCEDNLYVNALKSWKNSPFTRVHVLCGNQKGAAKLTERKQNFKWLEKELERLSPNLILTGSDRRIEFQFAMHMMSLNSLVNTIGGYLDDGLYSYSGRPRKWYKDVVSSLLKKITYGFWWEEPSTVGASSLIKQVYLFQPNLALDELKKNRQVYKLSKALFLNKSLNELSQQILSSFSEQIESYQDLELLIFVPHPNNVAKMSGYLPRLKELITKFKHKNIAVKYHPRVGFNDPLELANLGVKKIIPATLASEFILPVLPKNCMVIGDVGTALLTCRWLRSDLTVKALLSKDDPFQMGFISMMDSMGVAIVSSIDELSNEK